MNPVQVNCPECQKLFVVREEDLTSGQPRFQCTGCTTLFTFDWPQPPEVANVPTRKVESEFQVAVKPPSARPNVNRATEKVTQVCTHCGEKCYAQYKECPKCGVIFEKIKKIRPPQPILPANNQAVLSAWEEVKGNYIDNKKHESFVQLCLSRDNLVFASSQYRAVLLANPSDDIALKMQNRIIELATQTYLSEQAHNAVGPKKMGWVGYTVFLAVFFMVVGLFIPQLRSLIAIGCAIIVFVFSLRFFNR